MCLPDTDFTHLKASANKRKFIEQEVEKSVKDYVVELDKAVEEDRELHDKKPLSGVLQIKKNCMDFAIAGYGV